MIIKTLSKFDVALQNYVVEFLNQSRLGINNQLETMSFCGDRCPTRHFVFTKDQSCNSYNRDIFNCQGTFRKFRWQDNVFCIKYVFIESLEPDVAVISWICSLILNHFASWLQPYFGVHVPLEEHWNIYQSHALDLLWNCLSFWTRWQM